MRSPKCILDCFIEHLALSSDTAVLKLCLSVCILHMARFPTAVFTVGLVVHPAYYKHSKSSTSALFSCSVRATSQHTEDVLYSRWGYKYSHILYIFFFSYGIQEQAHNHSAWSIHMTFVISLLYNFKYSYLKL